MKYIVQWSNFEFYFIDQKYWLVRIVIDKKIKIWPNIKIITNRILSIYVMLDCFRIFNLVYLNWGSNSFLFFLVDNLIFIMIMVRLMILKIAMNSVVKKNLMMKDLDICLKHRLSDLYMLFVYLLNRTHLHHI